MCDLRVYVALGLMEFVVVVIDINRVLVFECLVGILVSLGISGFGGFDIVYFCLRWIGFVVCEFRLRWCFILYAFIDLSFWDVVWWCLFVICWVSGDLAFWGWLFRVGVPGFLGLVF